ncbi:MAG: hypothetical protein ACR2JC_05965 [Chloroflexota bacterium]|nr:MAG: hypothetical protein DLM70_05135 [Chloroflexota bacterium]
MVLERQRGLTLVRLLGLVERRDGVWCFTEPRFTGLAGAGAQERAARQQIESELERWYRGAVLGRPLPRAGRKPRPTENLPELRERYLAARTALRRNRLVLSVRAVATQMGVPRSTLDDWLRHGHLPPLDG